jgi:hypothetical protein
MQNQKITINNNKQLNIIRPFSSQKYYHNTFNPLNKTYNQLNNEKNIKNIQTKKMNNYIFYDNLSEKVLNLYDFASSIKSEHVKDNKLCKIYNKSTKNNICRDPYQNYMMYNKNKKNEINIIKNASQIKANNPLFKKININTKNKLNERRQNILKNRNIINYISPKINNFSNHYDFTKVNNYLSDNYFKNNKLFDYKDNYIERNTYIINQSPVGRFDDYFCDNKYSNYKLDKRKVLNNQILITNSINKDINKRLRIESPTSLSYHSYIRKQSPKEMSIEHNIEYDINNFDNKNKSKFIKEEIINKIKNIPFNEKDNSKIKTDKKKSINNILNYNNFKSVTISRLIRDLFFKNNDDNNNENKSLSNLENSNNLKIYYNKTNNDEIINELNENKNCIKNNININNDKIKKKTNSNNNTKNKIYKSPINKKIKKIIKNDIEIIIEYNNDNNIENLILKDKNGKIINFIPNKISDKTQNCKTINISSDGINKYKNYSLRSSTKKTIDKLKNGNNKQSMKENKSCLQSPNNLNLFTKKMYFNNKFNNNDIYENIQSIQSINITSPNNYSKNNYNIKRRIPINNINKKLNKYLISAKI